MSKENIYMTERERYISTLLFKKPERVSFEPGRGRKSTLAAWHKPDPIESLKKFYCRVRPPGPGWKPIAKLCPEVKVTDSLSADVLAWVVGCIFSYSAFFSAAAAYFVRWKLAAILLTISILTGTILKFKVLNRYNRMAELNRKPQT